jgi:hypothetical protein
MIRSLVMAAALFASTPGQAHDLLADADPTNDWIEGLANGENDWCCGTNDCYPLRPGALKITPQGKFVVEINGQRYLIVERYLLRDSSPDGRAWVCPKWKSSAGGYLRSVHSVRCLLLPRLM